MNRPTISAMPNIHPSAILEGDVNLASDVVIGPNCVVRGPVEIGAGTRLIGGAWIVGPTRIGEQNVIYPNVCIGFAPQSVSYDHGEPGHGVVIGSRNRFREGASIHRAMTDDGPTTIGDENYFMAGSHAGHDCIVGSNCILANCALLAGHVTLGDRVNVGGGAAVHQFVRIGDGAMLSGLMGAGRDLPHWFMLTGTNIAGNVNLIGMKRNGFSRDEIEDVRWVHRILCRSGLPQKKAVERLAERGDHAIVQRYIEFAEASDRGLCMAVPKSMRGTA